MNRFITSGSFISGRVYRNHGDDSRKDVARAAQWLEKAYEMSPNEVKCLQLLQMIYTKAGNEEQIEKTTSKLKLLTNQ